MSDDFLELFAGRPETIEIEGVGAVPVTYAPEQPPPTPVYPEDRLRVAEGVAWCEVDGELVIYDVRSRTAHVVNETAGLLWQCMDGEGTVSEIFADVADAFGLPLQTVELDFVPVISEWKAAGLVVDPTVVSSGSTTAPVQHRHRFLSNPPNG